MELKFYRNDVTVPMYIMEELRMRRGLDEDDMSEDADILAMSGAEFLNEWLGWQGIYGYTNQIIEIIQIAFGVDLDAWPFATTVNREIGD